MHLKDACFKIFMLICLTGAITGKWSVTPLYAILYNDVTLHSPVNFTRSGHITRNVGVQ